MNSVTKLSIAAACLIIADKLGDIRLSHEENAKKQSALSEDKQIETLALQYKEAVNVLFENYTLRDSQVQTLRAALRDIEDISSMKLNRAKHLLLEEAREKIHRVYKAVA